jgi:hypothetical protein
LLRIHLLVFAGCYDLKIRFLNVDYVRLISFVEENQQILQLEFSLFVEERMQS